MIRALKILRGVLVTLLILIVALPATFYIMLTTPWAQQRLREFGEKELSGLLGTKVTIGRVDFKPFNRIAIEDVCADDDFGAKALSIGRVEARTELADLIFNQRFIIDYAVIDSMDLRLYKADPNALLNIAGIIDKLRPKAPKKEPTKIKLRLNSLEITRSRLSYDVMSADTTVGRFNPSHIAIDSLTVDAYAPVISNDHYSLSLRQLAFKEQSGFAVDHIGFDADLTPDSISVRAMQIHLPNSSISFDDINASVDGFESIALLGTVRPLHIGIEPGSNVYLPDLAAFVPRLADIGCDVEIELDASGTIDDVDVEHMSLTADKAVNVELSGRVVGLRDIDSLHTEKLDIAVSADASAILRALSQAQVKLPTAVSNIMSSVGNVQTEATYRGSARQGDLVAVLNTGRGLINVNANFDRHAAGSSLVDFCTSASVENLGLGELLRKADIGRVNADISAQGQLRDDKFAGSVAADILEATYRGYTYTGIKVNAEIAPGSTNFNLEADDPNLGLVISGQYESEAKEKALKADCTISHLCPSELNLWQSYPGYVLSSDISVDAKVVSAEKFAAKIALLNTSFAGADGEGLYIKKFSIDADNTGRLDHFDITSDFLNGSIEGSYNLARLVPTIEDIGMHVFPQLGDFKDKCLIDDPHDGNGAYENEFTYEFTIANAENLSSFLKLPLQIIYPVAISGEVSHSRHTATLTLDAPWLQQGDKIIDNTTVAVKLLGSDARAIGYVATHMPTKKGPMQLIATLDSSDGVIDTDIDWEIERAIPLNGRISFDTTIRTDTDKRLQADVQFLNSAINFGDAVWNIHPSLIAYRGKTVRVDNLCLQSDNEKIVIDGVAGPDSDDRLTVKLANVHLDNIFETLEIDKALIGGYATGIVQCANLLGETPDISSTGLYVKDIGYNHCTLGDANINAYFNNQKKSFYLDADITGADGRHSRIYGDIVPASEELDITFDANRVRVGFMQPFMEAFASNVEGYASGHARLFGTFKYIDLEGDIYADSLRIKIDFTNTWYSASDSIHIEPGLIDLKNITIRNIYGSTAKLNGQVRHTFFKAPTFDFSVTDAVNFLSYDVTPKISPDWYGRIFGNGAAFVNGKPGEVNIGVNMQTAPKSTFTFVLSDTEIADEYSFITFRDNTPVEIRDSIIEIVAIPEAVKDFQRRMAEKTQEMPTAYNMDIQVDITPEAQMIIVMDPIGGDRIKANGTGNLRMTYMSANNDLRMYGNYTLLRGNYNFTLQDIIIKDFTIKEGSSITFLGDPYSAQLNIDAVYSVNANLSDLDESFLSDKELNRTNVPVHALLKVTGDMRQPDISFDLEFPTLTQDTYRKVRSIVSTEDMMNRQIIYLLALNRFYTPEYMASTTKGNELFSVASSTLSSQLTSMLGKLSENWSIAPNLRSDRGDFSDVEVDLTLSSTLLNNRLLFNGNFGYRDKSLNRNQFVGDFDIEYLLNRKGTWRLKAYNRYNDQNYYLRTAATTQGIGLMYRKDFDNLFNFLKPKHKAETDTISD